MTQRGFGLFGAVTAAAALLVPGVASAQEFLKDRRFQEGAGIKTGDLELHPGVAAEAGYDSNYFLRSNKDGANVVNAAPQAPVEGAGKLRITPSLSLSTIGPQRREGEGGGEPPKLTFRAGLSATYTEFFSSDSQLTKQRNVGVGADARMEILPSRPWGANLFANYGRTIQPTVIGDPNLSFNRDDIGVGGEIVATPGGGTLDWRFGYQFHDTIFEDSEGQPFNNNTHEANTRGRWKFRPRTALLYDATLRFITYSNQSTNPGALHNSTPVRARIGLNGLITPRFALLGMVGYGASFYQTGGNVNVQQYDSVIGQAELKWYLTANPAADQPGAVSLALTSLSVGYTRDFQNSYLGDYYGQDRGYVKLAAFFSSRVLLSIDGGVSAIEYPTIFNLDGSHRANSFTDTRADATLYGEYRFADSFSINLTGRYTQNFSNTQLPIQNAPGAAGPAQVYDMNWQRFEALVGARWFM